METCETKLRKSLLLAKYYIYYQKMNEKELNFCEFKQRWSCLLIIEPKQYTTQDNIDRSTKEYAKTSTV